MKTIIRAVSLFAVFLAPTLASAAVYAPDVGDVAQNLIGIINGVLVPLIFAVAFIVFIYGVTKAYIFSTGDSAGVEEGHKLILWGIIGFVVMVSLWGLVNVVANTFGLVRIYAPPLPFSPPATQSGNTSGASNTSGSVCADGTYNCF